jgi:geranylgeranyl diphosphate/geranylgeranyl-bacteriochlorophyllide a reductase
MRPTATNRTPPRESRTPNPGSEELVSESIVMFDVAVVGAGPAGAWAGYQLARGGARVALIDGSHPREKPCGGGVTGRTLELVRDAIPLTRLPAVRVEDATFSHSSGHSRMPLPADVEGLPALCVAPRRDFDGMLLAAAIDAGAEHVASQARSIERANGGWIIDTREGRTHAKWLFGADGANSLVRRRIVRPFHRSDLSIATGFFVRQRTSSDVIIEFEDSPAGYIWSFPRRDHLAVGICAQTDEATSSGLRTRISGWIEKHLGPSVADRYSWPIPSLRAQSIAHERAAGDRWMLLGDAAGLVDPITREGIYFAVRSGELAAESLLGGRTPAADYRRRIEREIHQELICAARLKARFYQPRFTGLLVKALQRSRRIREVMSDLVSGRQPYRGLRRRLLGTLELGLMIELMRARPEMRVEEGLTGE